MCYFKSMRHCDLWFLISLWPYLCQPWVHHALALALNLVPFPFSNCLLKWNLTLTCCIPMAERAPCSSNTDSWDEDFYFLIFHLFFLKQLCWLVLGFKEWVVWRQFSHSSNTSYSMYSIRAPSGNSLSRVAVKCNGKHTAGENSLV